MKTIHASLVQFGLSSLQAKLYQFLYNKPPQTIWEIAKLTELPRTTIYDTVRSLEQLGLIQRSVKYKSQSFSTLPVNHLQILIDSKLEQIDQLGHELEYLNLHLPQTHQLSQMTDVRFFHGKQGLQQMMHNALSAKDEIVGYSIYGRIEIVGQKFTNQWVQSFNAKGLKDRCLINPNSRTLRIIQQDVIKKTNHNQQDLESHKDHQQTLEDIRIIPEKMMKIYGDTMIYNNVVAVCYWREEEVVGFEVHNQYYAKSQKTQFHTFWNLSKPITSEFISFTLAKRL